MLTRLRVSGFKNLDVDVRFGPFTCIAGANGVGKSNVFDAIAFLSALARQPLIEAAASVRAERGDGDVRSLFTRQGPRRRSRMSFEADVIIPAEGLDDLGQVARAGITFVRYSLELESVHPDESHPLASLRVVREALERIKLSEAASELPFGPSKPWLTSAVRGRRTVPYISTDKNRQGKSVIQLHADSEGGDGGGRPRPFDATKLPRTVLSSANNAAEHRTAVLVRKEMMSWTQLHLEPSALRAPDKFTAEPRLGANGAHMPATLFALEHGQNGGGACARVARRLAELVENVGTVRIDKDDRQHLFEIVLADRNKTSHAARALSDGTLRFLALAILEEDPSFRPLLCLEEPENGIHPTKIPAMLKLLQDIAVDPSLPVGPDNPLRQVLINTHSPNVVGEVDADDLLFADLVEQPRFPRTKLRLSAPSGTWRTKDGSLRTVPEGRIVEYLAPPPQETTASPKRVRNRPEVQLSLFGERVDAAEE